MARRDSSEKRFSDDIERLLRGEAPGPTAGDSDYAGMLQFARRIFALRQEPRPEFTRRLRDDLLSRAVEPDEAREHGGVRSFLDNLLFGRPALRLALVSSFIVLAAVGLMWRAGMISPMMEQAGEAAPAMLEEEGEAATAMLDEEGAAAPPAKGEEEEDTMRVTEEAEETAEEECAPVPGFGATEMPVDIRAYTAPSHKYGAAVEISIVFENAGPGTLSLQPFPPRVLIREAGTDTVVRSFAAGTSQLEQSPMESTQYSLVWDQKDDSGTQVSAGRYEIDIDTLEVYPSTNDVPLPASARGVVAFDVVSD